MKAKFTAPYMVSGILALATAMNSSMSADNNKHVDDLVDSISLIKEIPISEQDSVPLTKIEPYATKAYTHNKVVLYILNTNDTIRRIGGTLAWRNNNPGNLIYSDFSRDKGAIGRGAGEYAVFPDPETGRAALSDLLRTEKYRNLTIANAIAIYATSDENILKSYLNHLTKSTGLGIDTKIGSLNAKQLTALVDAICVIEGWREGKIEIRRAQKPTLAMDNAKRQVVLNNMQHTL